MKKLLGVVSQARSRSRSRSPQPEGRTAAELLADEPIYVEVDTKRITKKVPFNEFKLIENAAGTGAPVRLAFAKYDYDGVRFGELPFATGHVLAIEEKQRHQWVGFNLNSGGFGTFPGNYVEEREGVVDDKQLKILQDLDLEETAAENCALSDGHAGRSAVVLEGFCVISFQEGGAGQQNEKPETKGETRTGQIKNDAAFPKFPLGEILQIVGWVRRKRGSPSSSSDDDDDDDDDDDASFYWQCVRDTDPDGVEYIVAPGACRVLPERLVKSAQKS